MNKLLVKVWLRLEERHNRGLYVTYILAGDLTYNEKNLIEDLLNNHAR